MRQDLIASAVAFLTDPKVQSSTLTSRIEFLETKGLTPEEIQIALRQAESSGVGSGSTPPPRPRDSFVGGNVGYLQAPPVPGRDWRDLFIMSVISGGVVFGVVSLARKYLIPHLQPPTSTTFESTSTSLQAQFDQAQETLSTLREQTTALAEAVESDKTKIHQVVEEVEECVRGFKGSEDAQREEMRDFRGEIESLKALVPRMIEKHTQSQIVALQDLQAELRSLKALLVSRQAAAPSSGSGTGTDGVAAPRASIPAWQMAGGSSTPSWKTPAPAPAPTSTTPPPAENASKGKEINESPASQE